MSDQAKKGALGEILSASQIITESDVLAALEEQRRSGSRFGEALVNLGIVTQEDIDWALSSQLDIPFIRLKKDMIDREAIALIPAAMAREFCCIPLFLAGGELNIALADPLNRPAIAAIELRTGMHVNISVALAGEINRLIDECYGSEMSDNLGFESAAFSEKVLAAINSDLTGSHFVEYMLIFILRNRISSLSLHPSGEKVLVRGRRGGVSRVIGTLSPTRFPDIVRKLMGLASAPAPDWASSGGSFTFTYRSRRYGFELALLKVAAGDYVTLSPQAISAIPERLADLRIPDWQAADLLRLARCRGGISFIASRSALERNRCMDLMLEEAETDGKNVFLLGDGAGRRKRDFPVMALPPSGTESARLIRDVLDHDPDILVIEDASAGPPFVSACHAAMAGRKVLAGLDIRGTRNVLRRLLLCRQDEIFLQLYINGLVTIEWVRLLCPECRVEYTPSEAEMEAMGLEQAPPAFYRPNGCEVCGLSGFRERRLLLDVLVFDDEFLRIFGQSRDIGELEDYLSGKGHPGIAGEALRLLAGGDLPPDEYIALLTM